MSAYHMESLSFTLWCVLAPSAGEETKGSAGTEDSEELHGEQLKP